MRAAASSLAQDAATPAKDAVGAKALLHVDDDERGAIAVQQGHQAPTTEKARSR